LTFEQAEGAAREAAAFSEKAEEERHAALGRSQVNF